MIDHPKQSRITDERKRVVIEGLVRTTPRAATDGITMEEADALYPRKSTVYTKVEVDGLLLDKADVGHTHSMLDLTDRVTGYTGPNYDVGTAKHLRWSRYGVNHEIIDASGSQAPDLTSINQVDAATAWLPDMPVLMGWNGISTYGVRVDRSRYADSVEYGGVVRVSTGGAATLASVQASNLSGPGVRPLVADPDGGIAYRDAATFRATIDAAASAHDHSHMATGLTFETGDPFLVRESHDLRGGVRTMNGAGPFGAGYYNVVDARHRNGDGDGADAYGGMIAWEMLSGYPRIAIRSRTSTDWTTWIELSRVGHDHASITVDGTTRISAGGAATLASLQASNLSGSGIRPLVADGSGNIDDQDAATFRATIGAAADSQLLNHNKGTAFEGLGDPFTNREAYGGHGGVRTGTGEGPFGLLWYNIVDVRHRNQWIPPGDIWGGELVWGMTGAEDRMAFRSRSGSGVPTAWKEVSTVGHGHQSIIVDGTTRISTGGAATLASVQASNLSGSGIRPMVADGSGNIDDQDAATFRATIGIQSVGRRLWAEKDKAQTYANNERSILGATSAQRMLAANTISDGTVIQLVAVGSFQASSSGSDLVVKLTCGPDGNYYSPYYLSSHGIPCAALASGVEYKVEALLYFVGSGASAGVYVELTIQFFGADGVVSTYRNASAPGSPLDIDGSIDRYLDVFFQVSSGTSSYSTITPTHSFAEIITP